MKNDPGKILEKSRPVTSLLDLSLEKVEAFLCEKLRGHRVEEAYLFGSIAAGKAGAWSDIDVIVVQETTLPFVERAREFADLFD
ncbi:MAG: nucleotidyltransferase domain-containing protein, partial [Desulfobulbaceae bacterium]|nr:nucleotidyltransferase domain-containing protein [Desulfobulbaceae bacterium]